MHFVKQMDDKILVFHTIDHSTRSIGTFPLSLPDLNGQAQFYLDRHAGFIGLVDFLAWMFKCNMELQLETNISTRTSTKRA
jgi:hypothetical protein